MARFPLELRRDDLVHVEEAVLLEADLDERGLHPGQDVVDGTEIDVAGDRTAFGALEVHLRDLVVIEDGDPLLADVDGDQQFAFCLRQRTWLRRLAPPALLLLGPLTLTGLLSLRLLLLLLGLRGLRGGLAGPAAPAATAAPSLRLRCLFGCARLCGGVDYGIGCFNWSGSLGGRLLVCLSANTEPTQKKSPSCARAATAPKVVAGAAWSARGRS